MTTLPRTNGHLGAISIVAPPSSLLSKEMTSYDSLASDMILISSVFTPDSFTVLSANTESADDSVLVNSSMLIVSPMSKPSVLLFTKEPNLCIELLDVAPTVSTVFDVPSRFLVLRVPSSALKKLTLSWKTTPLSLTPLKSVVDVI